MIMLTNISNRVQQTYRIYQYIGAYINEARIGQSLIMEYKIGEFISTCCAVAMILCFWNEYYWVPCAIVPLLFTVRTRWVSQFRCKSIYESAHQCLLSDHTECTISWWKFKLNSPNLLYNTLIAMMEQCKYSINVVWINKRTFYAIPFIFL